MASFEEGISMIAYVAPDVLMTTALLTGLFAHAHADARSAVRGYLGGSLPSAPGAADDAEPVSPAATQIHVRHFIASERQSATLAEACPSEVPWAINTAAAMLASYDAEIVGWYRSEPGQSVGPTEDDLRTQWQLQTSFPYAFGVIVAGAGDSPSQLCVFRALMLPQNKLLPLFVHYDVVKCYAMDVHLLEQMLYTTQVSLQEIDSVFAERMAVEAEDPDERIRLRRRLTELLYESHLENIQLRDLVSMRTFVENEAATLARMECDIRTAVSDRCAELWVEWAERNREKRGGKPFDRRKELQNFWVVLHELIRLHSLQPLAPVSTVPSRQVCTTDVVANGLCGRQGIDHDGVDFNGMLDKFIRGLGVGQFNLEDVILDEAVPNSMVLG